MNVIQTPTIRHQGGRRRSAALVLAVGLGPLATAAAELALPYSDTDSSAAVAAAAAAHPAAMDLVLWLDLLIALSLLAGTLIVSTYAIRAAPMLGAVGAVLSAIGIGTVTSSAIPPDLIAQAGAQAGVDATTTARILDALAAHPSTETAFALFLGGQVIGLILLGAALWRGHTVPVWTAVALIVSAPLHVVFGGVLPDPALSALSWALTAVAFGAVVLTATPPSTATI